MLPLVGFSRATTRRRSVVLPAPDPPTMHVVSPCRHTRSIPRSTSVSPKLLRTPLSTTMSDRLADDAEASRADAAGAAAGPLGMGAGGELEGPGEGETGRTEGRKTKKLVVGPPAPSARLAARAWVVWRRARGRVDGRRASR